MVRSRGIEVVLPPRCSSTKAFVIKSIYFGKVFGNVFDLRYKQGDSLTSLFKTAVRITDMMVKRSESWEIAGIGV